MNVVRQAVEDHRGLLDLTNDRVATPAEKTADSAVSVVMVEDQESGRRPTQEAPPALCDPHRLNMLGCQWEIARTVDTAFGHAPIMPYQPCHADVLLELANR